ncbi:CD63 antigen-like [Protopterus annectens]|uniref:CD63 antigen-like n=1 Tax=Protopterus annectens TaxID=7888 RepID=UPI001CFBA209|nr:CD63 antigen-like [Protopterus annectens]
MKRMASSMEKPEQPRLDDRTRAPHAISQLVMEPSKSANVTSPAMLAGRMEEKVIDESVGCVDVTRDTANESYLLQSLERVRQSKDTEKSVITVTVESGARLKNPLFTVGSYEKEKGEEIGTARGRDSEEVEQQGQKMEEGLCLTSGESDMMTGGLSCVKFMLVAFNFVFWVSGIALIIIGGVSRNSYLEYQSFTGGGLTSISVMLIVVGVFIAILSFLGCCGAWKENSCMLITFLTILVIILILQIAAGIAFYVLRSKIENIIRKQALKGIDKYSPKTREIVDDIQDEFHCCGVDSYTDWFSSHGWGKNGSVPDSCCKVEKETCGSTDLSSSNINQNGCLPEIVKLLKKNMVWIGAAAIGLGVVQVIGIIFSSLMIHDVLKKGYTEM